ncbi:DNA-binding protein [Sinorhizobium meliloti]|nr:DNA-binding protein [Sinorhizobium meliloti]
MTVAHFKELASISHSQFYREVKAGRLRVKKLGSKTLIARGDAQKWFESLPEGVSRGE